MIQRFREAFGSNFVMFVSLVFWEVDVEMKFGWEVLFVKFVKDKRE